MPQLLTTTLNGGIDPGIAGTGARASYAMLSYNTSSSEGGFALYDTNWNNPLNYGNNNSYNSYGASDFVYMSSGTYGNYSANFYNVSGTQSSPSSNSTSNYLSGINSCGEFGNSMIDVYSDGTFGQNIRSSTTWQNKSYLNNDAVNSNHSDKRNVYLLTGNTLRCVDRLYGSYNYPKPGTGDYTFLSPVVNSNMGGSASYHAGRKELTILSFSSGSGNYDVYTFQNVDFNLYPSPAVAMNRPEVVRVNSTVSLASNWNNNNAESYYNLKPIVTDNGKVYVSVFFTGSNFTLYEFTRSGTSPITGTYVTTHNLTTSYGRDQGYPDYGQRAMSSRDGTTVCTFCPYYYYGSGGAFYMIDRTNNTYTGWLSTQTSFALQPMPYQNSGWCFVYTGNVYSSNYTGAFVQRFYDRAGASLLLTQTGATKYFTKFTAPNTTNYPGYTQVVDYVLLTGNPVGVKLAR